MEKKDIVKSLVTAVLTTVVGLAFKYIDPPTVITEIWQRVFVGPWFLWLGAAGFGLYWFARFIHKLHKQTADAIPKIMTAHAEITSRTMELVEKESKSRVSAIDTLSNRINSLDTNIQRNLDREVGALHAKLDELIGKEAHARTDGINAINHRLDVDFERMNKLETSLPNQMSVRIQEIERKLTTQISALNERVRNVEPPRLTPNTKNDNITPPTRPFVPTPEGLFGLGNSTSKVPSPKGLLTTPEGLGLANSIHPPTTPESLGLLATHIPTTEEKVAQAILDRKKNKKET